MMTNKVLRVSKRYKTAALDFTNQYRLWVNGVGAIGNISFRDALDFRIYGIEIEFLDGKPASDK